jgi:hypothetical protein
MRLIFFLQVMESSINKSQLQKESGVGSAKGTVNEIFPLGIGADNQ